MAQTNLHLHRAIVQVRPDDVLRVRLHPLLRHTERLMVADRLRENVCAHLQVAAHEDAALELLGVAVAAENVDLLVQAVDLEL